MRNPLINFPKPNHSFYSREYFTSGDGLSPEQHELLLNFEESLDNFLLLGAKAKSQLSDANQSLLSEVNLMKNSIDAHINTLQAHESEYEELTQEVENHKSKLQKATKETRETHNQRIGSQKQFEDMSDTEKKMNQKITVLGISNGVIALVYIAIVVLKFMNKISF